MSLGASELTRAELPDAEGTVTVSNTEAEEYAASMKNILLSAQVFFLNYSVFMFTFIDYYSSTVLDTSLFFIQINQHFANFQTRLLVDS